MFHKREWLNRSVEHRKHQRLCALNHPLKFEVFRKYQLKMNFENHWQSFKFTHGQTLKGSVWVEGHEQRPLAGNERVVRADEKCEQWGPALLQLDVQSPTYRWFDANRLLKTKKCLMIDRWKGRTNLSSGRTVLWSVVSVPSAVELYTIPAILHNRSLHALHAFRCPSFENGGFRGGGGEGGRGNSILINQLIAVKTTSSNIAIVRPPKAFIRTILRNTPP